ncbi:hypothetical protein [Mesorhizobium sp.]|uniref:hypothetical protein n=1 Tax=Mesorhizobium sp. TaxID=1871066 RepID=UPI000FE9A5EE|nr:hypothetical protein [Mesorhizobium sp.]RWK76767.1 MAG: hypothetical protein EOR50_13590 [Mesorhizobium sp.]RWK98752.1 MAG: hypothetical protein EOR55_34475 [Mesorhizobium sp.]RWL02217.1 MAG: hypothetical protein EOR56_33645 [Mesorhizobium sp.]TIP24501.1 MAG: hypothetical protein E5X67_28810 [Mesorhizobium sp.]TIP81020.1 MAG: hypothetical protein E5X63_29420 [Mesorhizobium sp.]
MERFIVEQNIELYKHRLEETRNEVKRRILRELLAEAESRLARIDSAASDRDEQDGKQQPER